MQIFLEFFNLRKSPKNLFVYVRLCCYYIYQKNYNKIFMIALKLICRFLIIYTCLR